MNKELYSCMRLIAVIFFILSAVVSSAQVTTQTPDHNFGDMYANSPSFVDIQFTNHSNKVQYLLTIDKPRDVYYVFSGKKMLPDSSITIRFKVNDSRKGRFDYSVDVYFSEPRDPITIGLSGNIKELPSNPLTDCPDFNSTPPQNGSTNFDVTIKVIDSITREPIKNAQVYLVERGELVGDYKTNNQGIVHKSIPLGLYYITADKETYNSNYYEGYLNFKRNYVEIELSQNPVPVIEIVEVVEPPEDTLIEVVEIIEPPADTIIEVIEIVEVVEEPEKDSVVTEPPVVDEPEIIDVELAAIPDSVFDAKFFNYTNITFILDVSSSMNSQGKMDLLKLSMIELVKTLRGNDKVSVIKYSTEVETLLDGVSGDRKDEIIDVVKSLKTSGLTAGGNAIKAAYKINRREYIENGNNIVFMVTDGVFNRGDKDYMKTISKNYQEKGIRFSVVGIKTSDYITAHMKGIVAEGGGDFIRIITVDDARTKLINEIRRTAFKG